MKKYRWILYTIGLQFLTASCQAQTFAEYFQQKKTQKKYLMQQIVKLQLYLSYVKNGYNIVNKGLTTISHIKNGDFKLHEVFFNDLLRVKPAIRDYSKTQETLACISAIRRKAGELKNLLSGNSMFIESEQDFVNQQVENMLRQLLEDATLLSDVLTNKSLQMDDDERLKRIDKIFLLVSAKKDWITWCVAQCNQIYIQRQKERDELHILRDLHLPNSK
jgi:hypothetical protein